MHDREAGEAAQSSRYAIIPVATKGDKWQYKNLPAPPFRMLIIKPSGSGGSTLVRNMLSDRFPYLKYFEKNIFMFSPTYRSDPVYADCPIPDDNVFDEYNESVLRDIYKEQKAHKESLKDKTELEPILIILDDLIISLPSAHKNYVSHLFMSGRHYKISIIILSQSYKLISRGVRMNATHIISMGIGLNEARVMADECCGDFVEKLNKCSCVPYGWMLED